MDFLKRLLKKGREDSDEIEKPLSLDIQGLRSYLEEFVADNKQKALKESSSGVEEIFRQKGIARQLVEDLREIDFDEDIKDRTYRPIITSKPVYVRGMLEGLKTIKEKQPADFEELETFQNSVTKALKSIQRVQHKQGRYMSFAFRNEMLKLGSALNRIIDASKEIDVQISEVRKVVTSGDRITGLISDIENSFERFEEKEEQELKKSEEKKELEKKIKKIDKEIEGLERSEDYKSFLNINEEREDISLGRKNIESSIFSLISPLRRPLRKYEKHLQAGGGKVDGPLFDKIKEYQANPKKAFAEEKAGNIYLEKILVDLEIGIKSGDVQMGGREKKKTLARLEQLKDKKIKSILADLIKLNEKESDITKKLSKMNIEKTRLELIEKRNKYKAKRKKDEGSRKDQPFQEIDIEALKKRIEEELLKIQGRRINLELPDKQATPGIGENL